MKKRILFALAFIFSCLFIWAQSVPQGINYQAVARDSKGMPIANQEINFKISLLAGDAGGKTVYQETHAVQSGALGMFSLVIGKGQSLRGDFAQVPWSESEIWIEIAIDENNSGRYTPLSTSQLMAVPYALHAGTADEITEKTGSGRADVGPSAFWKVNGNNMTIPGSMFLGTLDCKDLVFKTNNIERMRITCAGAITGNGLVNGSGTLNFIPKWTPNGTTLGNSLLFDNGTNVGIGTTTPTKKLHVAGQVRIQDGTEGLNKILTSDATGNASWINPSATGILTGTGVATRVAFWDGVSSLSSNANLYWDNVNSNLGIGAATPTYRLDVEHGGSTGIRSKSTSSFSVVDIDAASGDAALRFAKAGVNQWNTRNRPADDYYEIFELGGGGSRVVIQDGTGNVGIGETANPTYKLDVLHGGSTGIRSRSSGSFSVVDIDAASGDAALRFAKAGVNQWNTRNRPADDYYEIFELGGGGSRMVIQDGTGNVGIGATVSPAYRLDVEHGGSTGIRSKSTATFSVIDIDGANGDAALRFQKAGVNQWNTRNNPATDDYQIFELGGGGERMRIDNTTGKVWVNGDFTAVGAKLFTMDHPLDPENKTLAHAAIESNEVMNLYSGNVTTDASGKVTVSLPEYFEAINKDFRYQLTVIGGTFAQAMISKEISNNKFEIATNQPNVKVSWEVKGVRNDARMKMNPFTAVQDKPASQKGKYVDPVCHNQPASKGVSYDVSLESSLNDVKATEKKATSVSNDVMGSVSDSPDAKKVTVKQPVDENGSVAPQVKKQQ